MKSVLLVNPWIHDFSAFDLWIQPLGLLYLAGVLKQNGFEVEYLDCLGARTRKKPDGRGKFAKAPLPTPAPLQGVMRRYGRYGISPDQFRDSIASLISPDAILVTSGMTYWYPGVQETLAELRSAFPQVPILLGGIYATLMPEHARRNSGADLVISGQSENSILPLLAPDRFRPARYSQIDDYPYPEWTLAGPIPYRILMTSRGCPYRCTFCASDVLNDNRFIQRACTAVLAEIEKYYYEDHITEFVFYDDALLIDHRRRLQPLLEQLIERRINAHFHTPNGLNAREVDRQLAALMFESGFRTIRLSLESVDPEIQKVKGNSKVNNALFKAAIENLYAAGYRPGDLECYLIMGLPGQTFENVRDSLDFVFDLGVLARLATFSPIPGTREAETARVAIGDAFLEEPLLQNHSAFPLKDKSMTTDALQEIKDQCKRQNERIEAGATL